MDRERHAKLERLSVCEAFHGRNVFITGATGFVGSLVLEQILRLCPTLKGVYVLAREKKDVPSEMRLKALLNNGLFHLLWEKPDVLAKVQVVTGDIATGDLGLAESDRRRVLSTVDYVIHAAADVALDDPIQETLNSNYCGTRRLLEFFSLAEHLKAFCYVSTAYVNAPQPKGTTVKERIYPLLHGDHVVDHEDIATELLELPPEAAEERAKTFLHRFGFPNTYCIGKHLTEQLVQDFHRRKFPTCIVRPSLVGSVAGKPYPGYIGNLAGAGGFAISYAIGFFGPWAAAWVGNNVTDYVPVDVVSSVILAATAATHLIYTEDAKPRIYHACTSTTYPITNHELCIYSKEFFTREPPPYCMLLSGYPDHPADYVPNPWLLFLAKSVTFCKVLVLSGIAKLLGKGRLARRLEVGYRAWDFANTPTYDFNLYFSSENVRQLDAMLVEEERKDFTLLWTPQRMKWQSYFQLSLAGVKCLLLKADLEDPSRSAFRVIPPRSTSQRDLPKDDKRR